MIITCASSQAHQLRARSSLRGEMLCSYKSAALADIPKSQHRHSQKKKKESLRPDTHAIYARVSLSLCLYPWTYVLHTSLIYSAHLGISLCVYVCTCVHVYTCICVHAYMCICVYVYVYIPQYICAMYSTYAYTYIRMCYPSTLLVPHTSLESLSSLSSL